MGKQIYNRGGLLGNGVPFSKYREEKLKMLTDEFCLKLTDEEIYHMRSLKTEAEVDRYAHQLLKEKL